MHMYVLVQLLLLVFFSGTCVSSSQSLTRDHKALLALKRTLDPQGMLLHPWAGNASMICSWEGVGCDVERVSVVKLNLSSKQLEGYIAPDIVQLQSLKYLALDHNLLSGEVPPDLFSKLHDLEYVDLSFNLLESTIPRNFSSPSGLQVLFLHNNYLHGEIPAELGSQRQLVKLNLKQDGLSGRIPLGLCNLTSLQYLALSINELGGPIPDCLGKLAHLEFMSFATNHLSGRIPPSLKSLEKLQLLDVSDNHLVGSIPSELGQLSSLQTLRLYTNELSGHIPPQLGNLSRLTTLEISTNRLQGEIPQQLAGLTGLISFQVFNNNLCGEFPRWLADRHTLTTITVDMNNLSGDVPQNLGSGNTVLSLLDISENMFTGTLPSSLCRDSNLEYFFAINNRLSGGLPEHLQRCKSLIKLELKNNSLSGSIRLSTPLLSFASFSRNSFNGSLLVENMSKLEQLDVSFNRLTATLPSGLEASRDIKRLLVSHNSFSGVVPPQLAQLKQLQVLDLSSNSFEGSVPTFISEFSFLERLNLSRNNFTGTIELPSMPRLSQVDLSYNHLSGAIPDSVTSRALTLVDLSYNNFSGTVPDVFKVIANLQGNPYLCMSDESCELHHLKGPGEKARDMTIIALIVVATGIFLIFVFLCQRRYLQKEEENNQHEREWKIVTYQKVAVPLEEILACVEDKSNLIAQTVYKGQLNDGRRVAVKKLQIGKRGDSEFEAEVAILGNIRHKNVVKLLASCSNGESHLLVYEYMSFGSLRSLLHGKMAGAFQLDWPTRLNIINGIAEGMRYLHHECVPKVVHRDIKCENILLDAEMRPHLGDFGLAKLLDKGGELRSLSKLAGTHGYLAPECAYMLKIDEKVDVYSFGIVMLELLTGKIATWRDNKLDLDLVEWVKLNPPTLLDDNLDLEGSSLQCQSVLDVALRCVDRSPKTRPTMQMVADKLRMINGNRYSKAEELWLHKMLDANSSPDHRG